MTRSYRHEIETALDGGAPDHVPFTFYDLLYPPGFDPRPLQALGMGVCARRNVYTVVRPNVKTKTVTEPDGSVRTVYVTPVGTLTAVSRKAEAGMALLEHPIKRLDDYRAAEFIVRDTHYVADYDTFVREEERLGHSGIVIAHTGYSPLLDLQIIWIGQEAFCYELADHEDAVLSLYDVLAENQRAMYEVAAASPARYVLHDGNIVPTMLGPERIQRLVLPCWQQFAGRLHERKKKMGTHLDADNRLMMAWVGRSDLDFVEAFTPPPDCPVSVAEARAAWPGKPLWINFPSSVHLQPDAVIEAAVAEILQQAGSRKGFLMGVTEDVPRREINRSCTAILRALDRDYQGRTR